MAAAFGKFSEKEGEGPPSAGAGSTSIVGRGTELTGDLTGSGQLRVEGRVDGTIRMDGEVQIAADGAVEGRIEADEIVAAGRVSGTIAARDAVRLEDGCQVDADVYCPRLELEEGGRINGRVDMSGDELPEAGGHARAGGAGAAEADAAEDGGDGSPGAEPADTAASGETDAS